tara:strand:+ start:158 stop:601 length:444 start_codon:yes stop_codon:yes gene_type:complete
VARRKKNKTKPQKDRVLEYDGWKQGDSCYTVFNGETKPSYCEVLHFHPKDDMAPSVSLTEITTGKYRVAAMMAIAETGKEAKKLAPAWNKFLEDWNTRQAKLRKKQRIAELKAAAKEREAAEKARAAEELAAAEEETKKKKAKKKKQ